MEVIIRNHDWRQVGGDVNPGRHGGVIAKADGHCIELLEIQPVRTSVGDNRAVNVGYPFWTREAYLDHSDLDLSKASVQSAMDFYGVRQEDLAMMDPWQRALTLALAVFSARGEEGPHGWARDIIPAGERVQWWYGKRPRGWRYLMDEDVEFRRMLREAR